MNAAHVDRLPPQPQGQGDVLGDRQGGQQVEALEDEPEVPPPRLQSFGLRGAAQVTPPDLDTPRRWAGSGSRRSEAWSSCPTRRDP